MGKSTEFLKETVGGRRMCRRWSDEARTYWWGWSPSNMFLLCSGDSKSSTK